MAKKKISKNEKPRVNPELEGFEIKVNTFGEIITNYDINKINEFLNKNVDDKKLRDRDDLLEEPEEGKPRGKFIKKEKVKKSTDEQDEEEKAEDEEE
ncbi:hypothetical protein Q0590_06625 [Rhodocytophaga aerolata]|uniref:Uncharacterized protein n=1 Tax=Rhodocytophaga aerolata TaxID=455078 RepID=A0ABT8R3X8_9BACT|nr:hypothetical protein [Rhodocytophaga aerolata]MDO1445918.1 hypothetical protein [Rhodocytophaga aerolata]